MITVYKPSQKGLSKSGEQEPNDRYLFTGRKSAIIYDATNNRIIEPFGYKSNDCYVTNANESVPSELYMTKHTIRLWNNDQKVKITELCITVGVKLVLCD